MVRYPDSVVIRSVQTQRDEYDRPTNQTTTTVHRGRCFVRDDGLKYTIDGSVAPDLGTVSVYLPNNTNMDPIDAEQILYHNGKVYTIKRVFRTQRHVLAKRQEDSKVTTLEDSGGTQVTTDSGLVLTFNE